MKRWALRRGQEILATITSADIVLADVKPTTPFIQRVKTLDGKLIATMFLAGDISIIEVDGEPAENKPSPSAKSPSGL